MESEEVIIGNYRIKIYSLNTLIIGSGAASLNAAVNLFSMGQKDIAIATSMWGGGTSSNAGSDKQTYYKLTLCGKEPDSVAEMARDLFDGKCMHGDIALCEAQGSVQAFMHLVSLGVEFPHDKYGAWAGYKTDHDRRARATSAGPYTSRRMFEALSAVVLERGIVVLDHHHCVSLLTDKTGSKVMGALAINTGEKDYTKAFVLFNSANIIFGTGGPGGIYETSVYPGSQSGSIGMALKAGATGQNLTESQFGIASLSFRWNLSGSYQQAIPRYVSTDKDGNDEKEFLNDFFPDLRTLTKAIFLKGYQWPFDPGKVKNNGSSLIDILVHREINEKQRLVFLDYSRNPAWEKNETFSPGDLDKDVLSYLRKSNALQDKPVDRLRAMNAPALALYKEHGIDLENEYLQIAVCAQHNNGGLKANIWWESDLRHLFPVGEVNGSHGVYRPGGSALNSGQVGSYRAALYISKKYTEPPVDKQNFLSEVEEDVHNTLDLARRWMVSGDAAMNNIFLSGIRKRMSQYGGIIRDKQKSGAAAADAAAMLDLLPSGIGSASVPELAGSFLLLDHCITHYFYLKTINYYLENGGRSRGSYIITDSNEAADNGTSGTIIDPELCTFDREIESRIIEVNARDRDISFKLAEVREIPDSDLWFERIWKEYLEDIYLDC